MFCRTTECLHFVRLCERIEIVISKILKQSTKQINQQHTTNSSEHTCDHTCNIFLSSMTETELCPTVTFDPQSYVYTVTGHGCWPTGHTYIAVRLHVSIDLVVLLVKINVQSFCILTPFIWFLGMWGVLQREIHRPNRVLFLVKMNLLKSTLSIYLLRYITVPKALM